ncbi:MAG: hypothetical protein IJV96_07935 [Clostridia bacterium]|nr:hypothetical protein [Clostridia bacterium]
MKKFLCTLLIFLLTLSLLAGCAGGKPSEDDKGKYDGDGNEGGDGGQTGFEAFVIPEGMSGEDVAKLLLANERLNATLLKSKGDIFESGAAVLRNLADTARMSLAASTPALLATPMRYRTLTAVPTGVELDNGMGKVELDGGVYRFSDFKEYNNSFDAFSNTTDGIVRSAEAAADVIDNVKKNVRVVDKWVDRDGYRFYLHVDENAELLIQRSERSGEESLDVCRRYKNERGEDVYELYDYYDGAEYRFESRVTYIPGRHYEFSTSQAFKDSDRIDKTSFVADNAKGYWETFTVSDMKTHYNVSCFVMKDDIAYDSFYDPKTGATNYLKVMSADKATDILHLNGRPGEAFLHGDVIFSGFDGIAGIEIEAAPDEVLGSIDDLMNLPREELERYKILVTQDTWSLMRGEDAIVRMQNGTAIRVGDTFADGKITVNVIRAEAMSDRKIQGGLGIMIAPGSLEETVAALTQFFAETGLVCRRDTAATLAGIGRAYKELAAFTAYYTWNGISIRTEANLAEGFRIERGRFDEMMAYYTAVRDAAVIDYNNKELLALNVSFAPASITETTSITPDGTQLTVPPVTLRVSDTLLFVEGEPYHVAFALVSTEGGGLVHVGAAEEGVPFAKSEDGFTVSGGTTVTLPVLTVGSYRLVAYLATSEGIRSSEYVTVQSTAVSSEAVRIDNIDVSAKTEEDGSLLVHYTENVDVYTALIGSEGMDYAALLELARAALYDYGTPVDAPIEKQDGEAYAPLSEGDAVTEGAYRVPYAKEKDKAGNRTLGYFYFALTLEEVAPEQEQS